MYKIVFEGSKAIEIYLQRNVMVIVRSVRTIPFYRVPAYADRM